MSQTSPSDSDSVNLGLLVKTLSKNWLIIGITAVCVTVLVTFAVLSQTKIYSARATIKIEPTAIRPLGKAVETAGDPFSSYWTNKEYYATEYKLLTSRSLAEEVVRILALHKDEHFLQGKPPGEKLDPVEEPTSVTDAAGILLSRLEVTPEEKTRLVLLEFEDASPVRAQRVLSTFAERYMERNLTTSVEAIGNAATWLNSQLDGLKKELEEREMVLHDYKKDNNLVSASLDDQSNMLRAEMEHLNAALTTAKTRREGLASRVAQLSSVDETDPAVLPAVELLASTTLADLRRVYIGAKTEVESLKSGGKGDAHPDVQRAQATMTTSRAALLEEIRNIKQASQGELAAAQQEIAGLNRLYREAERRAFDLNLLEIEFKRLARAKDNTERLHALVLERSKESELSGSMRFNNISIVDPPLVPKIPVRPRKKLLIGLGAFAGLALGIALVLMRDRLDRRIRTPSDVETHLGMVCLGTIPSLSSDKTGVSVPAAPLVRRRSRKRQESTTPGVSPEMCLHESPSSSGAEAIRALRTNLLFMSPDKPFRKLLITSAGPADGKTTIACSLAIALAQTGKSVLLLDADLRRPRLSTLFGPQTARYGVTSAVIAPETLSSCIVNTGIENLSLLPTGPLPPNPAELLHSASFAHLVETLSERFDYLLIDSPPLIPVTDAAILSRIADATLLIVRAGNTRRDHAQRAQRSLADVSANLAGVILNGVSARDEAYGYYQYYGYKTREPRVQG